MQDAGTRSPSDEAAVVPDDDFLCADFRDPETGCVRLAAARGARGPRVQLGASASGGLTSSDRRWFGPKAEAAGVPAAS